MIERFKKYIASQQHVPGLAGIWVNPFYLSRRGLCRDISDLAPRLSGRVLDVGCGQKPYQIFFTCVGEYVGLEVDTPDNRARKKADYFYDGETFPFDDESFDGLICSQVLEHTFAPEKMLQEIARVLKADGKLLLSAPFIWDEHEQPQDYARYSSFGLKHLLEQNGLKIIEQRKTNANAALLFQLINSYLYRILRTPSAEINLLICALLLAPFNLLGVLLGKILPSNPDLFLDQVVLAKKSE